MTEWAQNLKTVREYDSDETISHLITLRQIDDQVQDNLFSAGAKDLPLSDARTLMHVRFLESQLDTWKRDSQTAGVERCKSARFRCFPNPLTTISTQSFVFFHRNVAA